jgi:hypothetical protein
VGLRKRFMKKVLSSCATKGIRWSEHPSPMINNLLLTACTVRKSFSETLNESTARLARPVVVQTAKKIWVMPTLLVATRYSLIYLEM